MWRHHLAVWATHPTTRACTRWQYLAGVGLIVYLAAAAGSALEMATTARGVMWAWGPDAVVATWAAGAVVLFAYGQLVIVPRVTGVRAASARRPSLSPAGVHRWKPSRQVPAVRPTARYLSGRAAVGGAR